MIKHLQKIGNDQGIVIEQSILDMLNIGEDGAFKITIQEGGLFLKPINPKAVYHKIAQKHRKSLDKLAK